MLCSLRMSPSEAAVRAADGSAPGPLTPTSTGQIRSRDGTNLHSEWFAAPEPRAAAVIIHGYQEHCGRYREVANVLTRMGVAALSFDLRGHGRSGGQRGHTSGYRRYIDDLEAAIDELEQRLDDASVPLVLLGHSNGSLIALRTLTDPLRKPPRVAAAVLSSPFLGFELQVPLAKELVGRVAARWLPSLSLPSELRVEELTSDTGKQAERRVDTLCHDLASARWFVAAGRAQRYVLDHAARIDVPTLWLVAGRDRIADARASKRVRARLRAPAVYHELAGLEHEVFNERDRGSVFRLLETFLCEQFPA